MVNDRRSTDQEILAKIEDLREDFKQYKIDIKATIEDKLTVHDKIYFNGFEPHKHVADHHVIDGIVENLNDNKKMKNSIIEKWIDRILWAAITFIALSVWNSTQEQIANYEKPKTEIKQNGSNKNHP